MRDIKQIALELQPCIGNRSGIGMYAYEIAKHLRCDAAMSFCGNVFNFRGTEDLCKAMQGIDLPIRVCTKLPYGVYRRLWHTVPVSYEAFFARVDLTVFFNFIVPPRIHGKAITTVHDLTYLRYPETMDWKNLRRIQKDIAYSLQRSNRILTVSEFSKQELCQLLHVPENKVSVVYNAPVLSSETTNAEQVLQKHGVSGPYILYVGTLEPRKNLVRLIQAFAQLKKTERIPHKLVLAGGKGWNSEEIYAQAEKTADVLTIGYVSNAEKNALYQNAELFAFPSIYEGFGIPPLEAMSLGCPVVCANAASLPEVVGDAAELIEPMEVDSIAEGMLRVLADEPYRMKLVQSGYAQAKKFNWDDSANKLTQICREVLEES